MQEFYRYKTKSIKLKINHISFIEEWKTKYRKISKVNDLKKRTVLNSKKYLWSHISLE
jgi:hypothetical protein